MKAFKKLFFVNLKIVIRNKSAVFWTIVLPISIYIALSVLPIKNLVNITTNYSSYVLPGIIAMTIMQSGIYSLAYWMIDLKARGVIKRFMVTPILTRDLITSLLCSRVIIILFQTLILTLVGTTFFNAKFAGNLFFTTILILLGGGIFLLIGLLVSNFAHSYETAAPLTSAIALPLTFLGNIFYPVQSLPEILQIIAKALPITYLADGLRQTYLLPFNQLQIGTDILVLVCWFIGILLFTIKVFKLKE
jgi:ABC-2 type transport system permease protein